MVVEGKLLKLVRRWEGGVPPPSGKLWTDCGIKCDPEEVSMALTYEGKPNPAEHLWRLGNQIAVVHWMSHGYALLRLAQGAEGYTLYRHMVVEDYPSDESMQRLVDFCAGAEVSKVPELVLEGFRD